MFRERTRHLDRTVFVRDNLYAVVTVIFASSRLGTLTIEAAARRFVLFGVAGTIALLRTRPARRGASHSLEVCRNDCVVTGDLVSVGAVILGRDKRFRLFISIHHLHEVNLVVLVGSHSERNIGTVFKVRIPCVRNTPVWNILDRNQIQLRFRINRHSRITLAHLDDVNRRIPTFPLTNNIFNI